MREFEIAKMSHMKNKIDIYMTHDWPTNIINEKDYNYIFKLYPQNKEAILEGTLGSFPGEFILKYLKPHYFICGHMHFYYRNKINETEIFAFDKCLKKRHYFDLIEVKQSINIDKENNDIYIDPEWMAITNAFNNYIPNENISYSFINLFEENSKLLYQQIVLNKIKFKNKFDKIIDIENNDKNEEIEIEKRIHDLLINKFNKREKIQYDLNKQTELMLSLLDIEKENNKHLLSYFYMKKKKNNNAKKINKK